jgi:predicted Zn-dependent protease
MAITATLDSNKPTRAQHSGSRAGKGTKTIRVFNVRLALYTLLAAVLFGPATYAWRAYQLQRTAQVFLERADQLEAEQDWLAAASYLHRYLSLHPEENAIRIRMVRTFDRGAKDWKQKSQAVNLYYFTLGLIPDDEQSVLRYRLAELLLEMRRYSAAETEAVKLLAANDKDPQGRRLLALALYGQVQSGAAAARSKGGPSINRAFELALQSYPGDVQLSAILARVYRGIGRAHV